MRRKDILFAALAAAAAAGWLLLRGAAGDAEQKGALKERMRAAESAVHTLDAERAAGRERLRLARTKADEQRALSKRAAAALPFYQRRREALEIKASARRADRATRVSHLPTERERRADGTEETAADNAALLRRLNALLH